MNIAEHVISKIGGGGPKGLRAGVLWICHKFDLQPAAVYRWTYPTDKGGLGGNVPTIYQRPMVRLARAEGIDLGPDDFFDPTDLIAVNDNAPTIDVVNNIEDVPSFPAAPGVQV